MCGFFLSNVYLRSTGENVINKIFFRFPKDPVLRKKWCDAVNKHRSQPVSLTNILYDCYFEEKSFTSFYRRKFTRGRVIITIFK